MLNDDKNFVSDANLPGTGDFTTASTMMGLLRFSLDISRKWLIFPHSPSYHT